MTDIIMHITHKHHILVPKDIVVHVHIVAWNNITSMLTGQLSQVAQGIQTENEMGVVPLLRCTNGNDASPQLFLKEFCVYVSCTEESHQRANNSGKEAQYWQFYYVFNTSTGKVVATKNQISFKIIFTHYMYMYMRLVHM